MIFDLFLSYGGKKSRDPEGYLRDFFSFIEKISVSAVRREIFIHLVSERASCPLLLTQDLGLSQSSVYRELNNLVSMGLVERVVSRRGGRGRPYTVFAVKGYAPEDIVRAVERVARLKWPVYSHVKRISQSILEDYLEPNGLNEISWRAILSETRIRSKGFYSVDIANLVAKELSHEGIKVWR